MEGNPKRTFSIYRSISTISIILLIGFAIELDGSILIFINFPTIIGVFGLTFFMLLGSFGNDFLKFIPDSILTLFTNPPKPSNKFAEIALFAGRYSIGAAVIITILGYILMLAGLEDPDSISLSLALIFLPIFYALTASELFFAILYKAYSPKNNQHNKDNNTISLTNIFLPVIIVGAISFTSIILTTL